jgi:hypothetical protein
MEAGVAGQLLANGSKVLPPPSPRRRGPTSRPVPYHATPLLGRSETSLLASYDCQL